MPQNVHIGLFEITLNLQSFNGNNMFIAAQGPTPEAFDDFWRMVMEANVEYILMVTLLVENFKVTRVLEHVLL